MGGELNPFNWKWDAGTFAGIFIGGIIGAVTGGSIHSLLTTGKGIVGVSVGAITPFGAVELASSGPGSNFDLRWTTVAGGSGTIEDVIKTPERETAQVPLVQGPRVNVYVEGSYNDWVITTEEFKRLEEDFWIDSLLAGANSDDLKFTSVLNKSMSAGRLYLGARFTQDRFIAKAGRFRYFNGNTYSNKYYGGKWHSSANVQLAKTRFNSAIKFTGRISKSLTVVSFGATIYDGTTNGWENSHTADLVVTGVLYGLAVSNPIGWVVGGLYLVADVTTQYYTGETITQNLFND